MIHDSAFIMRLVFTWLITGAIAVVVTALASLSRLDEMRRVLCVGVTTLGILLSLLYLAGG